MNQYQEIQLNTTKDFVYTFAQMDNLRSKNIECLFRGHSDVNWKLLPAIARVDSKTEIPSQFHGSCKEFTEKLISIKSERKFYNEKLMLQEYKTITLGLLPEYDILNNTDNDLEWLLSMRHYGIQTRLLDWTESPLIALWFALHGNVSQFDFSHDIAIWLLQVLNYKVDRMPPKHLSMIIKSEVFKPRPFNRRIQAQQAWFTIHPKINGEFVALEDELSGVGSHKSHWSLQKYVVSASILPELDQFLTINGITKLNLYPDFEGLYNYFDEKYRIRA